MARERPKNPQAEHGANTDTSGATTGYEAELWRMADALRGSVWTRPNTSMSFLESFF